jgi:hypothetical protein
MMVGEVMDFEMLELRMAARLKSDPQDGRKIPCDRHEANTVENNSLNSSANI